MLSHCYLLAIFGYPSLSFAIFWLSLAIPHYLSLSFGYLLLFLTIFCYLQAMFGYPPLSFAIPLLSFGSFLIIFYCLSLSLTIFWLSFAVFSMSNLTILFYISLYFTIFFYVLQYFTLFCYIFIYFTMFCYVLLYFAIFCYILLCCAIFYYSKNIHLPTDHRPR